MNTRNRVESTPETQREQPGFLAPRVDITETKDEYLLEADMPGVVKDGLEVLLEANELTIVGRRSSRGATGGVLHRESSGLDFRRTFVLNPMIDGATASAQIDQGVLTVRLPKVEKVKPQKIAITN